MFKKLAKLPVRIAQFIAATVMGRNNAPAAEPPPPPPPRKKPAPPRPAPKAEAEDHGHDHGHSHGGAPAEAPKAEADHGHDHGHSHGGAPEAPKAEAPKAEADHGHDHGHDHGGALADPETKKPKPAKKAVDVTPEDTPNPNARKFSCSVRVVEKGSLSFASAEEAEKHPLGKAIFAVGGVKSVFAVNDFVTVTKTDDADWGKLTPKLVKAIKAAV